MDLPPDVVALTRGYGDSSLDSPWCIIDCSTGTLTLYTGGKGPGDKPWQTSIRSPGDFFHEMTRALETMTYMALRPVKDIGPEIWAMEGEKLVDARRYVRWMYKSRGWTGFAETPALWRREECSGKLKSFRIRIQKAEDKKQAHEDSYDDPDDEDYEDCDAGSDSETTSSGDIQEEESPKEDNEETSVGTFAMEVAEVWADLDEPEYMLVDKQLGLQGLSHSFPRPSGTPFRPVDIPNSTVNHGELDEDIEETRYPYDLKAVVGAICGYYELLSRMAYFPPSLIEHAPEDGWDDEVFPSTELQTLGFSATAIDLLRHLPYLGFDEHWWEVFPGSQPIRYLRDADPFNGTPQEKLKRKALRKLGLSPYKQLLPPDVVTIAIANRESWRGTWWLIDTKRGVIFTKPHFSHGREAVVGSRPGSSTNAQPIVPALEKLASQLKSLESVPIPGFGSFDDWGPEIWAEAHWESGADLLAKMSEADWRSLLPHRSDRGMVGACKIYHACGWPDQDGFRRDQCLATLVELRRDTIHGKDDIEDSEEHEDEHGDVAMKSRRG